MTTNQERKFDEMYGMVFNLDKLVAVQEGKYENLRENLLEIAKDIVRVEDEQKVIQDEQKDMRDDKNKVIGGAKVFSIIGFILGLFATVWSIIKG